VAENAKYLFSFFLNPLLMLVVKVKFGRGEKNRMNIYWCISEASNHFPKPAHLEPVRSAIGVTGFIFS